VRVNVIFPVKPAGGVKVDVSDVGLLKVPPPLEDHVAEEADPPILPFKVTEPFKQAFMSEPAFAVASES
jgi:hypothetical protein